ncbi:hypothetical protein CRE_17953 [Caenorhabditis remanei]|uniref:Uncharacterized protein n=1 Tax=Caenorhabditis remanei TaxID=31234 RepID=E3MDR2_CAERE|nr:hypothetical protein CRE_17953 [Caenorhabditis remanei]
MSFLHKNMSINGTLFPNETYSTDSIWRTKTPFILTVVTLSCQLFLFPFYAFIFIKNTKKEKHTPLYPISNVIFKLSIVFYSSAIVMLLANLWHNPIRNISQGPLTSFLIVAVLLSLYLTVWESIKVYHTILSLLALQRFLIYFYPETEKKVAVGRITTNVITCLLYLKFFIQEIYYFFNKSSGFPHLHEILSIILILSALLYIPMFISVRKQSNLMSAKMNKPHMFIIWQTLAVCIGKIYQVLLTDIDLMLIPLIIQVVYLGSTKQNLESLSLNMRNLFRRKSNQIQPYFIRDAVSSTQAATAPAN